MRLVFKIKKAENNLSPIEIMLIKNKTNGSKKGGELNLIKNSQIVKNTDELLNVLDKLLKKNKIKLESLKDVKVEIENGAGLTSTRIVLAIAKALSFDLE